eukprot:COSAG03_NODE_17999_length_364_cov_0.509434_1_plen_21_part_10
MYRTLALKTKITVEDEDGEVV